MKQKGLLSIYALAFFLTFKSVSCAACEFPSKDAGIYANWFSPETIEYCNYDKKTGLYVALLKSGEMVRYDASAGAADDPGIYAQLFVFDEADDTKVKEKIRWFAKKIFMTGDYAEVSKYIDSVKTFYTDWNKKADRGRKVHLPKNFKDFGIDVTRINGNEYVIEISGQY